MFIMPAGKKILREHLSDKIFNDMKSMCLKYMSQNSKVCNYVYV